MERSAGTPAPLLELRQISKSFPGCLANDAVDLCLQTGEIHALLGENGAGKSTLVKIVYGALHADAGEIYWQGRLQKIRTPNDARRLGIGMVFQHFSLFESLTVAENIILGLESQESPSAMAGRIAEISARYGLALDPARPIHSLSVGERQRVEIVRCLLQTPRLLIMDEPTSVLTPQECDALFETLRRLRAEGCTVLYISHKLEEIRALCDKATILRGGKTVADCIPSAQSARALAAMMIGGDLVDPTREGAVTFGIPRLEIIGLSLASGDPHGTDLKDINLTIRAGEIVGVAGVAGNGQNEFIAALAGEHLAGDGEVIRIDGYDAGRLRPDARRKLGLSVVPEERLGHSAVPLMSLTENTVLSGHRRYGLIRHGLVSYQTARDKAREIIQLFAVKATGPQAEARSLSGGNLQKFIVGREILQNPGVFVVSAPTWGVDAGAAAAIHQAILNLARQGAAVLVISQDLDELMSLTDRITVLFHGGLSVPMDTHATNEEILGLLMGGAKAEGLVSEESVRVR
jgi:simple sugar transport system ATP-binding protein|tara:strand:+ start:6742 stop:8301 length:1560 start_codon:yes stop_codon:yes gene_type:complete